MQVASEQVIIGLVEQLTIPVDALYCQSRVTVGTHIYVNRILVSHMSTQGQLRDQSEFHEILDAFPDGISHAFGYGSGVFAQTSVQKSTSNNESPMIDLLFSTENPHTWHQENLNRNPNHYAFLPRLLGTGFVTVVQNLGARVYFNPMVQVGTKKERLVKYGVIHDDDLKKDLKEWNCLYLAGRLHKPTHSLIASDEITYLQQEYNLKYAMSTALLILSGRRQKFRKQNNYEEIDLDEIFEVIAGLSYTGDPRKTLGAEDPRKVTKLVHSEGQLDRFISVYKHEFRQLEKLGLLTLKDDSVETNLIDMSTRKRLYDRMPSNLRKDMKPFFSHESLDKGIDSPEAIAVTSKVLNNSIAKIVGPPARVQTAKGLITAGVLKSFSYAAAKLSKGVLKGLR